MTKGDKQSQSFKSRPGSFLDSPRHGKQFMPTDRYRNDGAYGLQRGWKAKSAPSMSTRGNVSIPRKSLARLAHLFGRSLSHGRWKRCIHSTIWTRGGCDLSHGIAGDIGQSAMTDRAAGRAGRVRHGANVRGLSMRAFVGSCTSRVGIDNRNHASLESHHHHHLFSGSCCQKCRDCSSMC